MIDGVSSESEYLLEGRTRGQALEIDGKVLTTDGTAKPGEIVKVLIDLKILNMICRANSRKRK